MFVSSIVLALSLQAGPVPETYVAISRRSGLLRNQAADLAEATRRALVAANVPSTLPAEDATDCAAKKPCLLARARAKQAAMLVTLDLGAVLDEVLVHVEVLSVDEDGAKVVAIDADGLQTTINESVGKRVIAEIAPAIRKRLSISDKPVVAEVKPAPEPVPQPERPVEVATTPPPPPPAESTFWSGRRIFGAVIGVGGLAAVGTSFALLASAGSSGAEIRRLCPSNPCNESAAYTEWRRGAGLQNTAVAIGTVGGVALIAGALLVFLPVDAPTAVVLPTEDGAVMSFSGRF